MLVLFEKIIGNVIWMSFSIHGVVFEFHQMIYFRGDNKSSLPRRVFLVVVMQLVQLMYNIQFNVSLHSGF